MRKHTLMAGLVALTVASPGFAGPTINRLKPRSWTQ